MFLCPTGYLVTLGHASFVEEVRGEFIGNEQHPFKGLLWTAAILGICSIYNIQCSSLQENLHGLTLSSLPLWGQIEIHMQGTNPCCM